MGAGSRAGRSRFRRAAAVAAILTVGASLLAGPGSAGASVTADVRTDRQLLPGVHYLELGAPGTLSVNAVRVAPNAPVRLRPVLAHDSIGLSREPTSSMCRRAGGVVCVNGDFATCPTCQHPFGGVVVDSRTLRSFHPGHPQLLIGDAGYGLEPVAWAGEAVATYRWHAVRNRPGGILPLPETAQPPRSAVRRVRFAGLNIAPPPDAAVLYTRPWGAPTPAGGVELVLRTDGPIRRGRVAAAPVALRPSGEAIPEGAAVIVATGRAREALTAFWNEWRSSDADERSLVVDTATSVAVRHSVGGHPILVKNGQRAVLDDRDGKVAHRHPRTLVGWTRSGELLLVTVDGRQPGHSDGLTLHEATDLMLQLGAVDALNLDGGGSSTFVAPCPGGPCVVNRPSDGAERPVTVALALIPEQSVAGAVRPITPSVPPPPVATEPPSTPDPASSAVPVIAPEPVAPAVPTAVPVPVVEPPTRTLSPPVAFDGEHYFAAGVALPEMRTSRTTRGSPERDVSTAAVLAGGLLVAVLAGTVPATRRWASRRPPD